MTDEEKARSLVVAEDNRPARGDPHAASVMLAALCPECLVESIATALREVRAEEREKAAVVASKRAIEWTRRNVNEARTGYAKQKTYTLARECEDIAAEIRRGEG